MAVVTHLAPNTNCPRVVLPEGCWSEHYLTAFCHLVRVGNELGGDFLLEEAVDSARAAVCGGLLDSPDFHLILDLPSSKVA